MFWDFPLKTKFKQNSEIKHFFLIPSTFLGYQGGFSNFGLASHPLTVHTTENFPAPFSFEVGGGSLTPPMLGGIRTPQGFPSIVVGPGGGGRVQTKPCLPDPGISKGPHGVSLGALGKGGREVCLRAGGLNLRTRKRNVSPSDSPPAPSTAGIPPSAASRQHSPDPGGQGSVPERCPRDPYSRSGHQLVLLIMVSFTPPVPCFFLRVPVPAT